MTNYTKFREADKLVQGYLDIIVEKVRESVPGLKAIILSGGYGRGEGAIELINKKPKLINDFDIYLITKKQLSDHFLEELGKKCSRLIGKGGLEYPENYNMKFDFNTFFNVDLRCITYGKLKYLSPLVRYFEMKNSTTLIWGEDVRKLIPDIKPSDLPFSEGVRLLSNRMMNMFLSMKLEYLEKKPSHDEIGIVNYYICKAYLACCEALLLYSGEFKATYNERKERFLEIYEKKFPDLHKVLPRLAEKIDFMTEYKFNPDIKKFDYKKEWFIARNHVTEIFKYIILMIIKKKFIDWIELSKDIKKELVKYYFEDYAGFILKRFKLNFKINRLILSKIMASALSFLYFLKIKEETGKLYLKSFSFKDPGLKILSLTPLVLFSVDQSGKYKDYIERELKKIYPIKKIDSWNSIKENYLDVYKLYYLRRFV